MDRGHGPGSLLAALWADLAASVSALVLAIVTGFDFKPHYLELPGFDGLRLHTVEVGEADQVALCLHGQPSWSLLYRKMIPAMRKAGLRRPGNADAYAEPDEFLD